MVNVIIYLDKRYNGEDIVRSLLLQKLIATAVIDTNNKSYTMEDGELCIKTYNVITAQSKSLLINNIIRAVNEIVDDEVFINSTPIVGSNKNFDELIKQNTIPV